MCICLSVFRLQEQGCTFWALYLQSPNPSSSFSCTHANTWISKNLPLRPQNMRKQTILEHVHYKTVALLHGSFAVFPIGTRTWIASLQPPTETLTASEGVYICLVLLQSTITQCMVVAKHFIVLLMHVCIFFLPSRRAWKDDTKQGHSPQVNICIYVCACRRSASATGRFSSAGGDFGGGGFRGVSGAWGHAPKVPHHQPGLPEQTRHVLFLGLAFCFTAGRLLFSYAGSWLRRNSRPWRYLAATLSGSLAALTPRALATHIVLRTLMKSSPW